MNDAITPFTLAVPQADLEDLNRRIDQTRWPDAETVDDWLPGNATSSARLYWESVANVAPTKLANVASTRLELPVGVSIYPRETNRPSRRWVDRWMPNLIHYNILDRGGHFAAWEQPALHAKEIRDCFAKVRRPRQTNLLDRDLAEP